MTWDVAPHQDYISQQWGCTSYDREWTAPWCAGGFYHAGIDLGYSGGGDAACGKPVYATRDGVVVAVGANGEGNAGFSTYLGPYAVCIHYPAEGVYVEHGHLSAAHVAVGQTVRAGDHIGDIGTLGSSSACHLHVEARVDGPYQGVVNNAANVRDPRPYLNRLPTPAPTPAPAKEEQMPSESFLFYRRVTPEEVSAAPSKSLDLARFNTARDEISLVVRDCDGLCDVSSGVEVTVTFVSDGGPPLPIPGLSNPLVVIISGARALQPGEHPDQAGMTKTVRLPGPPAGTQSVVCTAVLTGLSAPCQIGILAGPTS